MPIYEFEGKRPKGGDPSFVHPAAALIGGVNIGENCYIGPARIVLSAPAALSRPTKSFQPES